MSSKKYSVCVNFFLLLTVWLESLRRHRGCECRCSSERLMLGTSAEFGDDMFRKVKALQLLLQGKDSLWR
jgi:hypothetical protein